MDTIGKRLREARLKKGITQAEVAKRLGVTRSVIARYEKEINDPPSENISRLAEILGVSADWLLGRTDDPSPPVAWMGREDNDPLKDLPEEARRSVLEFIDYVKAKYQKKGG